MPREGQSVKFRRHRPHDGGPSAGKPYGSVLRGVIVRRRNQYGEDWGEWIVRWGTGALEWEFLRNVTFTEGFMKHQYAVETFPLRSLEQRLNEFAERGWSCVAAWGPHISPMTTPSTAPVVVVFQREVSDAE